MTKTSNAFIRMLFFSQALIAVTSPRALAASSGGLNISQAIHEAIEQSPALRRAEAERDEASWGRLEALSAHLPHLSINGDHVLAAKYMSLGVVLGGTKAEFPSGFPQTSASFDASLLLFDGFSSINRYRASLLENEAASLRLARERFKLEKDVQIYFYRALAAQALSGVAVQNIKSLDEHLNLARAMSQSGYSTQFDVLRIEAQLEEARAESLLTVDNEILARTALSRLMGRQNDPRPLEGGLPAPDQNRLPRNLSFNISQRADLQAATQHEAALDKLSMAEAMHWTPQLSFSAQKLFYKFGDFNPAILANDSFQDAYSVRLKLTWNLFDGGASLAKSRQASAREQAALQTNRQALLEAPEEFETLKRRFSYNTALYEARRKAVAKSEESVRLAQAGLKAGVRTSTEWLDAELELFRSRAGLVRAQADAEEALLRLELSLGRPLSADH